MSSATAPTPAGETLRGIYSKLVAIFLFASMDAIVKEIGAHYPTLQSLFLRTLFGLVPLAWVIHAAGGLTTLRSRQPGLQAVRTVIAFGTLFGFFYLFPLMPLAELYAVSFAAPLLMTALSVPILRERVGWRRWAAVAVGFVGVLIIVRPGAATFQPLSILLLGATTCYALSMVLVRRLSRTDSDQATIMFFSVPVIVVAGLLIAGNEVLGRPMGRATWIWPSAVDWLWFIAIGLLGSLGTILMTRAWRMAPVAVLAPFDYVAIVYAMGYGWLFWSEVPTLWVWAGLPFIIGSGLYILHRERVRARERAAAPPLS